VLFSWTLLTRKPGDVPYMMGITDDMDRARRVAEPHLVSGMAFLCHIERVRYAMTAADMRSCYMSTGQYWVGRLAEGGRVAWSEHFGGPGVSPGEHCAAR
jgi:hypothetical protein